ncbi:MAG: hypothetical protein J0L70_23155 [Leptolyngbya sp. UWPOB_LEPTO1]|uniref:hypothetical protein n=1 Tax=Leptolyngbya sp. UWPOB_LEPTO1 TaxID=2815653 RepID=UPI001ACC52F3|nr:hypothetical protein [Leptolyngbya sp. UWPOB_LEPTO1]MBN8563439.1 hypothetical protein [Leptolyngbya sp. UWPOB_LEPTO1]
MRLQDIFAGLVALSLGAAITLIALQPKETLQHIRYEQDGKEIDKSTYDREFKKNPASVAECTRDNATSEVQCAGG